MVKHRRRPGNGVMASGAISHRKRRSSGRVGRVIGLLPGRQVTLRIAAVCRLDRQR
jgi:hypothetical protein